MPTPPSLFPAPAFAGWMRSPGCRWQRVCSAATEKACWDELLRIRPAHLNDLEKVCLPEGRHPNEARR